MDLEPTLEQVSTGTRAGEPGEFAGAEPDLDVEVVDEVPAGGGPAGPGGGGKRTSTSARLALERLHRLVLEARVATLEAELEANERRCEELIERYESVLEGRSDARSPTGTWVRGH